jgi:DNA primase
MGASRNGGWDSDREVYAPSEVEAVLTALGVSVQDETDNDFISLCPFHGNTDTPAFSTSKRYGYSICFNPACAVGAEKGDPLTLEKLVRQLKGINHISAKRFVLKTKQNAGGSFREKFDSIKIESIDLKEFPAAAIEKMHKRFMETPRAIEYMEGRGFTLDTMEKFKVGFTPASTGPVYRKCDMVVVPAYDHRSRPVGLVGRGIDQKEFKNFGAEPNGTGFHKSKIIWNLNNARRYETLIVTEAAFDAMASDQAGYPNVGAVLGGSLSVTQKELINRHFSTLIIATDNENEDNGELTYHRMCAKCVKSGHDYCQGHAPGRELGMKMVSEFPNLKILWAVYDDKNIYANNVKDLRAMTDDQIRQTLRNAVPHFEYLDMVA